MSLSLWSAMPSLLVSIAGGGGNVVPAAVLLAQPSSVSTESVDVNNDLFRYTTPAAAQDFERTVANVRDLIDRGRMVSLFSETKRLVYTGSDDEWGDGTLEPEINTWSLADIKERQREIRAIRDMPEPIFDRRDVVRVIRRLNAAESRAYFRETLPLFRAHGVAVIESVGDTVRSVIPNLQRYTAWFQTSSSVLSANDVAVDVATGLAAWTVIDTLRPLATFGAMATVCEQAPDWIALMTAMSTSTEWIDAHRSETRDVCYAGVALAHGLLQTAFELGVPMTQLPDGQIVIDAAGPPAVPRTDLKSIVQHMLLRGMTQVDIAREIVKYNPDQDSDGANDDTTLDLGLDEEGRRWHTTLGRLRVADPAFTLDDLPTLSSDLVVDSRQFGSNFLAVFGVNATITDVLSSAKPYIVNAAAKMLDDQMLYRHGRYTVMRGFDAINDSIKWWEYVYYYCWSRLPYAFGLLTIPVTFAAQTFAVKTGLEFTGTMLVSSIRGISNVYALYYIDAYFGSVAYNTAAGYDAAFLAALGVFVLGFAPFNAGAPSALISTARRLYEHIQAQRRQLHPIYRSAIDVTTTLASEAAASASSSLFGGSTAIDADAVVFAILSLSAV